MPANPITPPPAELPQLYQRSIKGGAEEGQNGNSLVQALGSVLKPSEAV